MVPARFRGRHPATEIKVRALSMVEIGPDKIAGLGAWLRKVSAKTAAALENYELKPDLFNWKSLIKKSNY
jgi:hypothetical protein